MNSPASTDAGSVKSTTFSDQHCTSPATSIECHSPQRALKVHSKYTHCGSDSKLRPECKSLFVEALVDSAAIIIETVWPCSSEATCYIREALSLKRFIQETLRRSRTSYSTLQLALYYILRIKQSVYDTRVYNRRVGNVIKPGDRLNLRCGRRAFLASLMIASKYVQDRNYSVRAWAKISGLPVNELCEIEQSFLSAMDWNAHVKYDVYEQWSGVLFECACDENPNKAHVWTERFRTLNPSMKEADSWRLVVSSPEEDDSLSSQDSFLESTQLTCANLQCLSSPNAGNATSTGAAGVSLKRKALDDCESLPSCLEPCSKRMAMSQQFQESTQTRVHEWTLCVATHLLQSISDPMSMKA